MGSAETKNFVVKKGKWRKKRRKEREREKIFEIG
jgi:hypothetical protein